MANEGIIHGQTIKNNTTPLGKVVSNDILAWWAVIGTWIVRQNVTLSSFTSAQLSNYPAYPAFVLSNKQRFLLVAQNDPAENGLYEYNSTSGNLENVLETSNMQGGTAIDITNGIVGLKIAPNTAPLTGRYKNLIRTDGAGRVFVKIGTSSSQILQLDANGDLIISQTLLNNMIGGAGGGSGQNLFYMQGVSATGADESLDNVALTKTFTFTTNENISHLATVEIEAYDPPESPCFEQPSNIVIDRRNNTVSFDLVKLLGIPSLLYTTRIFLKNPGNAAAFNEIGLPPYSYEQYYEFTHEVQPSLPFVINSVTVNTVNWVQAETRLVTVALYTNVAITDLYEILDLGANFEQVGAIVTNNPATGALSFNVRPVGIFPSADVRTLAFRVRSMPYVTGLHSQNITINRLPFEINTVTVDTVDWEAGETRQVTVSLYTNAAITAAYSITDFGATDFTLGAIITNNPGTGTLVFEVTPVGFGTKTLTFNVASGVYETTTPHSNTFYVFAGIVDEVLANSTSGFVNRSGLGAANSQLIQPNVLVSIGPPFTRVMFESSKTIANNASTKSNELLVTLPVNLFDAAGTGDRFDFWVGLSNRGKNALMYAVFDGSPTGTPAGEPQDMDYWVRFTNPDPASDNTFLTAQFYDTSGAIGASWNALNSIIRFKITGTDVRVTDQLGANIGGVPRISAVTPPSGLYAAMSCKVLNQNPNWNVSLVDIPSVAIKGEWA